MKKLFVVLFAACMLLPVSCNKTGKDDTKDAVLEVPATKEQAQVVTLTQPATVKVSGKAMSIKSMEFTESSRYIIKYVETKAEEVKYKVGSYSYSNGVFNLEGFGTVKIEGGNVEMKPTGGETVTAPASTKPTTTTTTTASNASRTWKVSSVYIHVTGGSLGDNGAELQTTSMDLPAIAKTLKLSDAEVSKLSGYVVKEVIMTGANTFAISFTGADPICGSWNLSSSSFSYNLSDSGIAVLNGTATGTIKFPTTSSAKIEANANISGGGNTYKANIELSLTEVK